MPSKTPGVKKQRCSAPSCTKLTHRLFCEWLAEPLHPHIFPPLLQGNKKNNQSCVRGGREVKWGGAARRRRIIKTDTEVVFFTCHTFRLPPARPVFQDIFCISWHFAPLPSCTSSLILSPHTHAHTHSYTVQPTKRLPCCESKHSSPMITMTIWKYELCIKEASPRHWGTKPCGWYSSFKLYGEISP